MLNLRVDLSEEQIDEERQKIQEQLNAYRNMVFSYILTTEEWNDDLSRIFLISSLPIW